MPLHEEVFRPQIVVNDLPCEQVWPSNVSTCPQSSHELRNEVVASSKPREKYASLKKKELVLHKGGIYEQYR
jgi:hypothetical protein